MAVQRTRIEGRKTRSTKPAGAARVTRPASKVSVEEQLSRIEESGGSGILRIARKTLKVSNLAKVYFPEIKRTKGDLMRYYERASPYLLPIIDGRPLVLKRFPNGVNAAPFFQQNAADPPEGVRTADVPSESGPAARIIGGDLLTLLYCVQLGAIEVNPWHSRVKSLDYPDYTILDLDPGPKATFRTIVNIARWLKEFLDEAHVHAGIKTSGSRGLHIVIPLPPKTNEEAAQLVSHVFAQRVADAHPKEATVVRSRSSRPDKTVYVDYLQNIVGKSVACAFSVRAKPDARVSMPLDWSEVNEKLDPSKFTLDVSADELASRGKLWRAVMTTKNSLSKLVGKGR